MLEVKPTRKVIFSVLSRAAYLLLAVLSIIMLLTILQYKDFKEDVGFLLFKQDYLSNAVWKSVFYIHVFSCFVCLFAGFTQFSNSILRKSRSLHRLLGRVYAYSILLINFPAGLFLAFYANGGIPTKVAFSVLAVLWFVFTLRGVLFIRQGNQVKHREFMIRSYALTLSALTLRLWKLFFVTFTELDSDTIYMMDAWLGFVPNLLFAEWLIRKSRSKLTLELQVGDDKQNG